MLMTTQNPYVLRVQNIPNNYLILQKTIEIDWLKEKFGIKKQYNYLFYKQQDNDIVSIYGSYGHSAESEIYYCIGEKIA